MQSRLSRPGPARPRSAAARGLTPAPDERHRGAQSREGGMPCDGRRSGSWPRCCSSPWGLSDPPRPPSFSGGPTGPSRTTRRPCSSRSSSASRRSTPGTRSRSPSTRRRTCGPTLRAAFTAGSGFPDVFYYDNDVPEFIPAGWLADMSTGIRWENIEPYGKAFWTRPGPGGKVGPVGHRRRVGVRRDLLQQEDLPQLGIAVPANGVFTQEQFKDVVAKCTKAGHAAFATGAAGPGVARPVPPGHAAPVEARLDGREEAVPGRAELEGSARRRGVPVLQGAGRPRRILEDDDQHDAGRGPPVFPHGAEGVHVPGGVVVHGPRVRPAGEGRTAPGLRARTSSTTPS